MNNNNSQGGRHVLCRVALALYLLYLAGCAWAFLEGAALAGRQWQDLVRFLAEVAAGLPWSLPVLALPGILGYFDPQASGDGFMRIVHAFSAAGVVANLLVLNRWSEWRRPSGAGRPFEATS